MNLKSKKIGYVAMCFTVIFVLATPLFLLPFWKSHPHTGQEVTPEDAVFLELWNIDTFEGGRASRSAFLERQAIVFEEKYNSVFVVVRNLSPEQAQIQLENGILPDFVSFGTGIGDILKPFCEQLDLSSKIRKEFRDAGEELAVPWCMGGYILCSQELDLREPDKLLQENSTAGMLGFGGAFNVALIALENEVITGSIDSSIIFKKSMQADYLQYNAYEDFLSGEFEILLGSQRDFYRLRNRIELGALSGCDFHFLSGYTDLIQWFSVTTTDANKQRIAEQFIEHILSEKCQAKLVDLGMFSVLDVEIYASTEYADFEQTLLAPCKVGSAFWSKQDIVNEKEKAMERLFGGEV